jgi:predicted oxidoreductase
MNIITVNHTDLNGVSEALEVVMADEAIEIEALKAKIEVMKKCEICKHYDNNYRDAPCVSCADKTDLPKWELAK